MSLSLKEQLAAKKQEAEKVETAEASSAPTKSEVKAALAAKESATATADSSTTKSSEKQPEPEYKGPEFRKSSFAYEFKYSKGVIKADKNGIYTPKNSLEFEILKHQVRRGNILFN